MTTDRARESSTEEVTRLRDSLNDLASIMAQPTLWTGGGPPQIVNSLLDSVRSRVSELIAANELLTKEVSERRRTARGAVRVCQPGDRRQPARR